MFGTVFVLTVFAISVDCPNVRIFAQGLGIPAKQPAIWTSLQGDCCTASGISCTSQLVTQITWPNKLLNGFINWTAIPTGVNYLDTSNNVLTGTMPFSFPNGLSTIIISIMSFRGPFHCFPLD
jgi:hypothetical protein